MELVLVGEREVGMAPERVPHRDKSLKEFTDLAIHEHEVFRVELLLDWLVVVGIGISLTFRLRLWLISVLQISQENLKN